MGRFLGQLPSDLFGVSLPELKVGVLEYTKEQMGDLDVDGVAVEFETSQTEATTCEGVSILAQPPCPRQITVIVKAADAAEVTADATATVYGTNIAGDAISEVLTFTANLATALTTAKAFKTVSKVVFTAQADGTPAFNIGWNEVFGLPFMFAEKPLALEQFDGAMQFTAGTFTVDADEIEKNTYDPNGNLDGLKPLKLLLFL